MTGVCRPEWLWCRAEATAAGAPAVVLIDGGSGSGKSTLADAFVAANPGAQLVRLDDCYPGWQGLAAGSAMVARDILGPSHGYRRWDWAAGVPAEWIRLDPARPLVVEGCGALTPSSRALAHLAVWCRLEAAARKRRALARDGATFAAHWEEWAAQEERHWARHRPWLLADVVCDQPAAVAPGPM